MSTAPRGGILYRYTPGVGRVAAVECNDPPTRTCATAFSTADQSLVAGTTALVLHDTVPFSYGIEVTTGAGGGFLVLSDGVYKIIPSLQCLGGGNGSITIFLKVNGANVANTATKTAFKNADETVITCEYLLELTKGDFVQVWALAQAANCTIDYVAGDGIAPNTYPATPGVITNMYRLR